MEIEEEGGKVGKPYLSAVCSSSENGPNLYPSIHCNHSPFSFFLPLSTSLFFLAL